MLEMPFLYKTGVYAALYKLFYNENINSFSDYVHVLQPPHVHDYCNGNCY